MSEEEIEAVLNQFSNFGVSETASEQEITVEVLREELAQIKVKGYAVAVGERNPDV